MRQGGIKIHALVVLGFLSSLSVPAAVAQAQSSSSARPAAYQNWLDEDVRYLISDQERSEFNQLQTDQQRDDFIIAFWQRRNPTPLSARNPFKEEHYRRLSYANSHFADRLPGYKTDRGHLYVAYGPPDFVERQSAAHVEVWHYSFILGLGEDIDFRLVDRCGCGEYRIPVDDNDLKKYSPK